MRNKFIGLALEAINFQSSKSFFKELTQLITDLQKEKNLLVSKIPLEIAACITKHTNIRNTFNIRLANSPNAAVYAPRLDINHPFVKNLGAMWDDLNRQGRDLLIRKMDNLGYVDLQTGRVYGSYREITVSFHVNTGIFSGPIDLSPEEIAATILHEIGHCFAYFEYLGSKVTRNLALVSLTEKLFGSGYTNHEQKVELITTAKMALNLSAIDINRLAGIKSKQETLLLLIDAETHRLRSELGTDFYDATSWEYVSDQYAARQGAALPLVTSLAKASPYFEDGGFLSTIDFMIIETTKLIIFLLGNFLSAGLLGGYLIWAGISINPLFSKYDRPKDRLIRIRQQIIAQISETDDLNLKKLLLEDIHTVDIILKDMNSRRTLYEYIFSTFVKSHKNDLTQQQIQKDLEAIGMNDLFVSAARLQTLL